MEQLVIYNVRTQAPAGYTPVYVGRTMRDRADSVLGNPLRPRNWDAQAEAWVAFLQRHPQPGVRAAAERAALRRQFVQGQAAALYLPVLREQSRRNPAVRACLQELASAYRAGTRPALACWCAPQPCHAKGSAHALQRLAAQPPEHEPAVVGPVT